MVAESSRASRREHSKSFHDEEDNASTADDCASHASSTSSGGVELGIGTYPRRWLLLTILFGVNLHSDWTCFSMAPVDDIAVELYPGLHPEWLMETYFICNVLSALFEPWIVGKYGLRRGVLLGSGLTLMGSFVKAGLPGFSNSSSALVYVGFVLCGVGQPLLQISALDFVSNWFPMEERSLATMLYVNSDQLGVGFAFALGPPIVSDQVGGLVTLNHVLAAISLILFACVWLFVESRPLLPPSKSTAVAWANPPPQKSAMGHLTAAASLLKQPNFRLTLMAFALSGGMSNVVSTYLQDIVEEQKGYADDEMAGAIGATFQAAVIIGSALVGVMLDRRHAYREMSLELYALSIVCATALAGVLQGGRGGIWGLWITIVFLGLASGPLKPLSADLGVEVSYPSDENHCLLVQFLTENVFSYLLLLTSSFCARPALAGTYFLLAMFVLSAGIFWSR
jgi:MFS family permease